MISDVEPVMLGRWRCGGMLGGLRRVRPTGGRPKGEPLLGEEENPFGPRAGGDLLFVGEEAALEFVELERGGGSCGRGGGRLFWPFLVFFALFSSKVDRGGGLPLGLLVGDVLPSYASFVLLPPLVCCLLGMGRSGLGCPFDDLPSDMLCCWGVWWPCRASVAGGDLNKFSTESCAILLPNHGKKKKNRIYV